MVIAEGEKQVQIRVLPTDSPVPVDRPDVLYLVEETWNDWWRFETLYTAHYVDGELNRHFIGGTKIGQVGMSDDQKRPNLPKRCRTLPVRFFSLAQDASFYERLDQPDRPIRDEALLALRDIAYDLELFAEVDDEPVTGVSLLREVSRSTVRGQFHRVAHGGARRTNFAFRYVVPDGHLMGGLELDFKVRHSSKPPTNIHVLVGRNAVGKSTLLNAMAESAVDEDSDHDSVREGFVGRGEDEAPPDFSNLVSVSFSAFDAFEPISVPQDRSKGRTYHYVGLKKKKATRTDGEAAITKDHKALSSELTVSAKNCLVGARRRRLWRALTLLESDPVFAQMSLSELLQSEAPREEIGEELRRLFRRLSSGHRIVLLTICKLVETVEEKSLVLLDEPEAHLHPPLLSAFVRALSDLLANRNGVAIIATHSPVVLQEVPRSCVYKLNRSGREVWISRPEIETFAENSGTLTNEVFGLEVTATGFHTMLSDVASEFSDYQQALEAFRGQLGAEGRAILRARIAARRGRQHVEG